MADQNPWYLRILSQQDVIALGVLDLTTVSELVKDVYIKLHTEAVNEASAPSLRTGEAKKDVIIAHVSTLNGENHQVSGVKWVSSKCLRPDGNERQKRIALLLNDNHSGPVAILEGVVIGAMRTAGATALACEAMAPRSSRVAAIIGTGSTSHGQVAALVHSLPDLNEIRVFTRSYEKGVAWATKKSSEFPAIKFTATETAPEAVRSASVVVAVSTYPQGSPGLLHEDDVGDDVLYISVSKHEASPSLLSSFDNYVSTMPDPLNERQLSYRLISENLVAREQFLSIGDVLSGKVELRKNDGARKILFDQRGVGALDVALGKHIFQKAVAQDLGVRVHMWDEPYWS